MQVLKAYSILYTWLESFIPTYSTYTQQKGLNQRFRCSVYPSDSS